MGGGVGAGTVHEVTVEAVNETSPAGVEAISEANKNGQAEEKNSTSASGAESVDDGTDSATDETYRPEERSSASVSGSDSVGDETTSELQRLIRLIKPRPGRGEH